MSKIIIFLFACASLWVLSREFNVSGYIRNAYVSAPVHNGSDARENEKDSLLPLKNISRSLAQIVAPPTVTIDKSYTGLSLQEEESILSNIDSAKLKRTESQSLWTTITNAYIKNYSKLFRSRGE
ncbi:MAG: hypothetical protein A2X86_14415 [Bdellovibrionales bacterium GWA2_49_15]|nr:MAG: hypothetical protein A2X86_14415 [Bdellovibrionales bacterium GWA2_49_15]HAZ13838.1 hypothetical protein [Bdellovibrionales bacterium]